MSEERYWRVVKVMLGVFNDTLYHFFWNVVGQEGNAKGRNEEFVIHPLELSSGQRIII
jgi:hypothetical protein